MTKFFQRLRQYFFWYFLKEQLRKKRNRKGSQKVNLDKAKSVGILFDATDLDQRKTVLAYADNLRKKRKQVKLLGFFDNRLKDNNFTFWHFNKKNIDWAMRPKGKDVSEFIEQPFDLMINLNPESEYYSEYISALSNASFKIGPFTENTFCYDLMIDTSKKTNLRNFIDQMEGLLKKTNV